MNKILLDTSAIIDFLRSKNKENTRLAALLKEDLSISILTHTELFGGKSVWENTQARKQLKEFFMSVTIIPLSEKLSEQAGYIKAHLKNSSLIDCIIAATAIEKDCELVTLNVKDFEKIPHLKLHGTK